MLEVYLGEVPRYLRKECRQFLFLAPPLPINKY